MKTRRRSLFGMLVFLLVVTAVWQGFAQAPEPAVPDPESVESAPETAGESTEDFVPTEDVEGLTLLQLIYNGGYIMIPIGALSVIALLLILFYSFTITERALVPKKFLRKVYDLVNQGNFSDAQALCEKVHGLLPRMLAAGLRRREMGILAVSDAMAGAGTREIERYRQWIRYLSDIAAISPMLGLLGTIFGMIKAFDVVAAGASTVDPVTLAGAVSTALVTTAAGLIVAIPTMGFYYYFRGRLVRISTQVEEKGSEFAERITGTRPQQGFLQEAVNARR